MLRHRVLRGDFVQPQEIRGLDELLLDAAGPDRSTTLGDVWSKQPDALLRCEDFIPANPTLTDLEVPVAIHSCRVVQHEVVLEIGLRVKAQLSEQRERRREIAL